MKSNKNQGLVPTPAWQDSLPLVWYRDDGRTVKVGRHCVMKGGFVFARYNRRADAELVVRRILSALDPTIIMVPITAPKAR